MESNLKKKISTVQPIPTKRTTTYRLCPFNGDRRGCDRMVVGFTVHLKLYNH